MLGIIQVELRHVLVGLLSPGGIDRSQAGKARPIRAIGVY